MPPFEYSFRHALHEYKGLKLNMNITHEDDKVCDIQVNWFENILGNFISNTKRKYFPGKTYIFLEKRIFS